MWWLCKYPQLHSSQRPLFSLPNLHAAQTVKDIDRFIFESLLPSHPNPLTHSLPLSKCFPLLPEFMVWSTDDYGNWGEEEASVGWDWLARGVRVRATKACRRDVVHKSAVRDGCGGRGGVETTLRTPEGKNRVKIPVELKRPNSVPDSLSKKERKKLFHFTHILTPPIPPNPWSPTTGADKLQRPSRGGTER